MAAGTVHRDTTGGRHDLRDHVIKVKRARAAAEDLTLCFNLTDEIPRPGREETRGGDGLRIIWRIDITRDLLTQKQIVGFVGIERTDDVVAVAPGIVTALIALKAVGVGVMRDVEPVAGISFAVAR